MVQSEPVFRVAKIILEATRPDEDRPITRFEYRVIEWAEGPRANVPRKAVRESFDFKDHQRSRTEMTLVKWKAPIDSDTEGQFHLSPKRGSLVRDLRMHLRYVIGETGIVIDEIPFATKRAVNDFVADDLPDMLGAPVSDDSAQRAEDSGEDLVRKRRVSAPTSTATAIGFLAGGLVLALGLTISRRGKEQPRRHRGLMVVALLTVLVTSASLFPVYFLRSDLPPSASITAYDFGDVVATTLPVVLSHEFQIRNTTGKTSNIIKYGSDCGCTHTALSTKRLLPGQMATLSATMELRAPGRRSARLWVTMDNGTTQSFRLVANAILPVEMKSVHQSVYVKALRDSKGVLLMAIRRKDDAMPHAPLLRLPSDAFTATFSEWRPVYDASASNGKWSRWQGVIRVQRERQVESDERPILEIFSADQRVSQVHLDGWPW